MYLSNVNMQDCEWCGTRYNKTFEGRNVCGTCQLAEAVRMVHGAFQFERWRVLPYKLRLTYKR